MRNLPANAGDAGDLGLIPGREDALRRKWQPTPVFLPEKPPVWRSLADYSPWGHKESDTLAGSRYVLNNIW